MFNLPYDIQKHIADYANLSKYWKNLFSNKVLPYINKGYRLTGINTSPCNNCLDNGYLDKNIKCNNCFLQIPCIRCWWYNYLDYDHLLNCIFCDEFIHVSYNNIKYYLPIKEKYKLYSDFLKSNEWLETLNELDYNKLEILNEYMNNLN